MSQGLAATVDGARLYQNRCATCHEQAIERTPSRDALCALAAENVAAAITTGVMLVLEVEK